jgi:hypothetical protein
MFSINSTQWYYLPSQSQLSFAYVTDTNANYNVSINLNTLNTDSEDMLITDFDVIESDT